ncbi:MAG: hydroxyacid dehydrogenase [Betaproteobacteria bacterium RIFCSPLOWO2_02_FULL_65_20]|nr:MAG: hydroxyacid dehydrogenase [Betaproteobacteria bacterium RIFCSPLOWO2_02_FULL_65_20]
MLACAILDDYQGIATTIADWRGLSGKVDVQVFRDHIFDRAALAEALQRFEIVVAMRERTAFDAPLFERLPNLKLLVTTGLRNASIDLVAAEKRGVTVCGTQSAVGSTSELAWGLIFSLMRDIPAEVARFRAGGRWQAGVGRGVHGKTLGVVGVGNLGARAAKAGVAFGMDVSGWSRSLTEERCRELGIRRAASLDELLAGSDVITLHLTLNAQSRGLIGEREFGLMRPGAILVNTSRGPIVDERALIDALRGRRIAGAGIDVYDVEPLPDDHPFRSLDNLVATPHLGYVTEESYRVYYGQAVEDIAAWMGGNPVRVLKPAG